MRRLKLAAVLLVCWSAAASAATHVVQFHSAEDPASPPDASFCATAPFKTNVLLGASLYAYDLGEQTAMIRHDHLRKIGTATACAQLTNFTFPAGLQQNFYVRFDLPEGRFEGLGTCTLTSNNVPVAGFVLAGCALNMTAFPSGVAGGAIASLSSFNPFRLPGFATGSYWTLQYYDTAAPAPDDDDHDSDAAMEWIDEGSAQ